MRFQKQELESFNLSIEEEQDLEEEVEKMLNFDKSYQIPAGLACSSLL